MGRRAEEAGGKAKDSQHPGSDLGDALILPAEALFPGRCSCTYSQEASET